MPGPLGLGYTRGGYTRGYTRGDGDDLVFPPPGQLVMDTEAGGTDPTGLLSYCQ